MSEKFDFEQSWLKKFSRSIENVAGEEISKNILKGSESHSDESNREEIIKWSKEALEKLEDLIDNKKIMEIMTGCACQYPKKQLQEIRKRYEETKDIGIAHKMLQERFKNLLHNPTLGLTKVIIDDILEKGWGSAGIIRANKVIATKIPKSGFINEYYKTNDPKKKRQIYCHCPRVRDALKVNKALPETYCYCGAGFYKGIWEEILQKPVKVKMLKSVMKGDDVCSFEIQLPTDI